MKDSASETVPHADEGDVAAYNSVEVFLSS